MYHSKREEERARVAKIREAARISGREARVKEGLANISTGKVRECRQLKSGANTAQGSGTHGINRRRNNNNNNGPNHNNNNNKRRREREDRRQGRREV